MKWINIKDKLPEDGIEVLTFGNNGFKLDYLIFSEFKNIPYIWGNELIDDWHKVTHWMPLPDNPEE